MQSESPITIHLYVFISPSLWYIEEKPSGKNKLYFSQNVDGNFPPVVNISCNAKI